MTRHIAALLILAGPALAQDNALARDEVAALKKKLVAAAAALGAPPEGYAKEREDFNLPTEFSPAESGKFWPLGAEVRIQFSSKAVLTAQKDSEALATDYQQKYAAAVARGDYEAASKAAMEMSQRANANAAMAIGGVKPPISATVSFNYGGGSAIDPDLVVMEKSGVIALKEQASEGATDATVHVYFQPKALKDTKKLSRIDLQQPEGGLAKKLGVYSAHIELRGPAADVEAWAKRIDAKTVLGQIDAN
jgi:hypothetical protein